MTPETIARVDAWLVKQDDSWRVAGDGDGPVRDRLLIADEWRHKSRTTRADGPDAGDRAAMTGILLALVREAWGDPTIFARSILGVGGGWKMTDADGNSLWCDAGPLSRAATEAEALTAALEAAPAKEATP